MYEGIISINLRGLAKLVNNGTEPEFHEDDLIYSDSATWDDWANHIPQGLAALWPALTEETRLALFIVAKSFTNYSAGSGAT